jgi:hypothetical protein
MDGVQQFKPVDDFASKDEIPNLGILMGVAVWAVVGFVSLQIIMNTLFISWAKSLTETICENRANGTSPW